MTKDLGPGTDITCTFRLLKHLGRYLLIIGRLAVFHLWAVSENYIVITGASIPTLSPLWRRKKPNSSDLRGYEMYGNNRSGASCSVSRAGTGRVNSKVQNTVVDMDPASPGYSSTSQELILESKKSEIIKTTEVEVSYSDSRRF